MKNPNEFYSREEREEMADELRDRERAPAEGAEPHAANNWRHWNELCKTAQEQARVAIAELASLREQLAETEGELAKGDRLNEVQADQLQVLTEQLAQAQRERNSAMASLLGHCSDCYNRLARTSEEAGK